MGDFLDVLARDARKTIDREYYETVKPAERVRISLMKAILESKANPIVTEIKTASPSAGVIRTNVKAGIIAKAMAKGGATAISVLTEPIHFSGSLEALTEAREAVKLPILMKDIILSPIQIEAASKIGANAVLLIKGLFDRGYCEKSINAMIDGAHLFGLEVLLETHTETEFCSAVKTGADLIGINNRDLGTLKVDLNVTKKILIKNEPSGKLVIAESGINTPADIFSLRRTGARAFLIGSAIMASDDVEEKVKEFVNIK